MTIKMRISTYGVILALITLAGILPSPTKGNVIDQRVLQRDTGENSPEMLSINDKDEFRELDEPVVNDYIMKTKNDDQNLENAVIDYLFTKQMMNKFRARTDMIRAQKKRVYWKQCAFNAVSCFG